MTLEINTREACSSPFYSIPLGSIAKLVSGRAEKLGANRHWEIRNVATCHIKWQN
jgi:cold shock CspA family protein